MTTKNTKHISIVAVLVVLVLVVIAAVLYFTTRPPAPVNSIKNAAYTVDGKSIALTGSYAYFGNEAAGDLNNDGQADIAFIFTSQPGGSGTFYYVAVALHTADGWTGTNAVLVGDRIAPQTTEIRDGLVTVNYTDRNPGEPFTTKPSLGKSMYLRIVNGTLTKVNKP